MDKLGKTQEHVLLVLAGGNDLAANDYGWYPAREPSVRSALNSLGFRGLVDVAGWTQGGSRMARTYRLTAKGYEVVAALTQTEEGA